MTFKTFRKMASFKIQQRSHIIELFNKNEYIDLIRATVTEALQDYKVYVRHYYYWWI